MTKINNSGGSGIPNNRINNPNANPVSGGNSANTGLPSDPAESQQQPSPQQVPPGDVLNHLATLGAMNSPNINNVQLAESMQHFMALYPPDHFDALQSQTLEMISEELGLPPGSAAANIIAHEAVSNMITGTPATPQPNQQNP